MNNVYFRYKKESDICKSIHGIFRSTKSENHMILSLYLRSVSSQMQREIFAAGSSLWLKRAILSSGQWDPGKQ